MGARQKLNQIAIQGALITGGVFGVASRSWLVFAITTAVLVGVGICYGDIRPSSAGGERNSRPNSQRSNSRRSGRR